MKRVLIISTLLLFAAAAVFASGPGPCGDVDDDPSDVVSLGDITVFQDYFFMGGSPLPAPADADCDGKEGITYADVVALTDHMMGSMLPLDCSASGRYDFTLILEDTVIMPMARCIPVSQTRVTLDIELRMHSTRPWVYLPFDPMAPGSSGDFVFTGASGASVGTDPGGTLVIAQGVGSPGITTVQLNYQRTGTGMGEIRTGLVDIDTYKRYAIITGFLAGNWDLRRPVTLNCWQIDYPEGDMDCDCQRSLGDLTMMIDGLFITLTWPSPCPCGF